MIDEKDYAYLFGQIAISKGFITRQQLDEALGEQIIHNVKDDNCKLIGEILLEKRWMTQDQITMVLEALVKSMHLQLAKIQS